MIVRGVYLFGERLAQLAYGRDVAVLYSRMYPHGGMIAGYLAAARSFQGSCFMKRAREAAERGCEAARHLAERRRLERAEQTAADELEALLRDLDAEAGLRQPEGSRRRRRGPRRRPIPPRRLGSIASRVGSRCPHRSRRGVRQRRGVWMTSFGCQMNLLDAELVSAT